jgi:hypothetical protein
MPKSRQRCVTNGIELEERARVEQERDALEAVSLPSECWRSILSLPPPSWRRSRSASSSEIRFVESHLGEPRVKVSGCWFLVSG